jgi:hypothetical protein
MEKDLSNLIWSSGIGKLVTGSNEQQTWRQFAKNYIGIRFFYILWNKSQQQQLPGKENQSLLLYWILLFTKSNFICT